MKKNISLASAFLFICIFISGCAQTYESMYRSKSVDNYKSLSGYKSNIIKNIGPFLFEKRVKTFEDINKIVYMYRGDNALPESLRKVVGNYPSRLYIKEKIIFDLKTFDIDLDGEFEQFAYFSSNEDKLIEFGYAFDLGMSDYFEYIVIHGADYFFSENKLFVGQTTISSKDLNKAFRKGLKRGKCDFHLIDSNSDEVADILVCSDCIDKDGNGIPDQGFSAWIYDLDFNGTIDKVEYIESDSVEVVDRNETGYKIELFPFVETSAIAESLKVGGFSFKDEKIFNKVIYDLNSLTSTATN